MKKVIIIDDESAGRKLIRDYLADFPDLILVQEANNGVWPLAPPPPNGQTTVALFTDDPFGGSPLLIESFAAGDFATGAVVSGPNIDTVVETFESTSAGLSNPTPDSQRGTSPSSA